MQSNFITIILGFIEGFALIISPCILPILPIFLAGSLLGSKTRSIGIIIGFTITFAIIAFFSRQIVLFTGIDLNTIRHLSYIILVLLGLVMMSSYLSEKFNILAQPLSQIGSSLSKLHAAQSGILSGLILGGLIAIIWTPCAGPILAAVIVQTVVQKTTIISFFILLAFALGAALPMLIIALYGRQIIKTFELFKRNSIFFRKFLGIIIIASVGYMIYQDEGYAVSSSAPETTIRTATSLENGLWVPYKAPEITGITAWINSPPLTIHGLKGKVILIDFWTYSCINCVRTLPYLNEWYRKYHDEGLVIIGVHSPEFDFEKSVANVNNAVKRNSIHYPVALDNNFSTWRNYNNHYWPAHYLINQQGQVVYQHYGEGFYDVTENNIRFLLGIDNLSLVKATSSEPYSYFVTPETYLGYARANRSLSPYLIHDKIAQYTFPTDLLNNAWALQGTWQVNEDKIISAAANATIKIHFNARKVFIVMGTRTKKPLSIHLLFNNQPLTTNKGKDVHNSSIVVDKDSIYEAIAENHFTNGTLEIIAKEPGIEIYTFTFGS